jgi:hypothetical protein
MSTIRTGSVTVTVACLGALTIALSLAAEAHAQQQPTQQGPVIERPTREVPKIPTFLQVIPSECPLRQPDQGALTKFQTTMGTYTAYGNDKTLLPLSVEAFVLEGADDRLTFGSRTTIRLPNRQPLDGRPYPVVPNMTEPPTPVTAVLWESTDLTVSGTIGYTFPVTAPAWQILGTRQPGQPARFVCLYLGNNEYYK